MAASIQCRAQERSLGMVMKEVDEDLALFLEMCRSENEKHIILQNSCELDDPLESKTDRSSISKSTTTISNHKPIGDDFLSSENEKTDYDWLLTPPGTPLFPSLEIEAQKSASSQLGIANAYPTAPKSMPANLPAEPSSRSSASSKQPALSNGANSSSAGSRRPSASGGPIGLPTSSTSRSATPNGRSTLPVTSKPSRPSTPTSRATLLSAMPKGTVVRSSTPTGATARSSTPTARAPIQAASKLTSRSATPNHRQSIPLNVPSVSASSAQSSVSKSGSTTLKNLLSRGTSPTVRSRPRKPSDMPGFSHDAPSNLRTSVPERPASASKGRLCPPSAQSTSTEITSNGRIRQKSCSPSRGRAPNGSTFRSGSSVRARRQGHSNGSDDVNPVLVGSKMVERVVNMRKLAPPKSDDHLSSQNNYSGELSSLQDNSGFGRTLSKSSLDMALRHMDIRRSISGNLWPVVTKLPASSVYGVRSGSNKSRAASVSNSPLATSSNASSEPSTTTNFLDQIEVGDNGSGNERGQYSPTSQQNE